MKADATEIGGRVRVNRLAARWGAEIGVDALVLARGMVAAYARGDFDRLAVPDPVVTVDHETLAVTALSKEGADYSLRPYVTGDGKTLAGRRIDVAIRAGWLQIHKEAVDLFAGVTGYAKPTWLQIAEAPENLTKRRGAKKTATLLPDVVNALRKINPGGPPTANRKVMKQAGERELGDHKVSDSTLDRARKQVWPKG